MTQDEGPVILYIEDEPASALLVQRALARQRGADVTVAPTVAAGLELAAHLRPDVVLVDLNLPDGDGLEVVDALAGNTPGGGPATGAPATDARATGVPTIVVTADGTRSAVESLGRGARAHLTKPFALDDLCAAIDRVLDRARTRSST